MSFLVSNCCLKLNYLVCGSAEYSSKKKKKKFKSRQKTLVNAVSSNNKVINQNEPSPITFYRQYNINATPQQQSSPRKTLKSTREFVKDANCSDESLLNCSIDYRLSERSRSTLNNGTIIKDVILCRNNPNERLGLILCYGITSKSTINIYIEQIDKDSIADRQGQLRTGDQIIKINNHRVTNRDQAIHLVNGTCRIILQIIRFKFPNTNLSTIESTITTLNEDDSGVIVACNTDFEINNQSIHRTCLNPCNSTRRSDNNLSSTVLNQCSNCRRLRLYSEQIQYRRCLSLNDLRSCSINESETDFSRSYLKYLIRSQSIFGITTDNENAIVKPLPFNHHQHKLTEYQDDSDSGYVLGQFKFKEEDRSHSHKNRCTLKDSRRRCREERLKKLNESLLTTDDEIMSELKQGRYWTRQERKQQFQRSKQNKQRTRYFEKYSIYSQKDSTTEDFNLLNRIFLRENQRELKEKPYLAIKYRQQSSIERDKLKKLIENNSISNRLRSQSYPTESLGTTIDQSSSIII